MVLHDGAGAHAPLWVRLLLQCVGYRGMGPIPGTHAYARARIIYVFVVGGWTPFAQACDAEECHGCLSYILSDHLTDLQLQHFYACKDRNLTHTSLAFELDHLLEGFRKFLKTDRLQELITRAMKSRLPPLRDQDIDNRTADIKRLENDARKFILRRLCFTLITLKRF